MQRSLIAMAGHIGSAAAQMLQRDSAAVHSFANGEAVHAVDAAAAVDAGVMPKA